MELDHELIWHAKRLDYAARHDAAAFEKLYSEDFLIHRLDGCGKTMTFDKRSVIAFFEARRNDREPYQNESVAFLHASQSGDVGMVVGQRTMQTGGEPQELLFTQVWRHQDGGWRMIREAVTAQAAS